MHLAQSLGLSSGGSWRPKRNSSLKPISRKNRSSCPGGALLELLEKTFSGKLNYLLFLRMRSSHSGDARAALGSNAN